MKTVFMATLFLTALLAELLLGNAGFPVGLLAFLTFYFAREYGHVGAFLAALIAGSTLDLLYNRPHPFSIFILLAAAACALLLLRGKPTLTLLETALPGLAIGIITTFGNAMIESCGSHISAMNQRLLWHVLFNGGVALFLVPFGIAVLDTTARLLKLPTFIGESKPAIGGRPRTVRAQTLNSRTRKP